MTVRNATLPLAAFVLCLSGCGEALRLFLSPPEAPQGARSMVLGNDGKPDEVQAFGLPLESAISAEVDSQSGELEILYFNESLSELGFPHEGEYQTASGPLVDPLPQPVADYVVEVLDGRATAWGSRDGVHLPGLVSFRIRDPGACPAVSAAPIKLDSTGNVAFMIELDDERALVGTAPPIARGAPGPNDDTVFLVESRQPRAVSWTPQEYRIRSGFRSDDGRLWFGGENGEIFAGTLQGTDLSLELIARTSTANDPAPDPSDPDPPNYHVLHWIDGGLNESTGIEIFALSTTGRFHRLLSRSEPLELVHEFQTAEYGEDLAGVRWLESGRALAVSGASPLLAYFDRTDVSAVSFQDTPDGLTAVGHVPEMGIVVATGDGEVFLLPEGRPVTPEGFESLGVAPDASRGVSVTTFLASGRGFYFGGGGGIFGQYDMPHQLFCPALNQPVVISNVRYLARHSGGILIGPDRPSASPSTVLGFLEFETPEL